MVEREKVKYEDISDFIDDLHQLINEYSDEKDVIQLACGLTNVLGELILMTPTDETALDLHKQIITALKNKLEETIGKII